ncbi:MAG: EboA domain-containing protein [Fibrobacteria bacterium]
MKTQNLLFGMLVKRMEAESLRWLEKSAFQIRSAPEERLLYATYSAAIRYSGKGPLHPSESELLQAADLVPGWDPGDWTLDQAARIALLLSLPATAKSARWMDAIYQTSDLGEALALMKALPLLPLPAEHLERARMGARSNVKSQFEAVAVRNPFPARHFDEAAWNQLVSKAIFVETPLRAITGLDERGNRALNRILTDLVRERRAAGRTFDPWLYRCIAVSADGAELDLLESLLESGSPLEREAALGGLARNPSPRAALMARDASTSQPATPDSRPIMEHPSHVR